MSRKELSETVDTAAFKHANAAETPAVVRGAVHSLEPTEGPLLTEELQRMASSGIPRLTKASSEDRFEVVER
jgi:hypothetical protein